MDFVLWENNFDLENSLKLPRTGELWNSFVAYSANINIGYLSGFTLISLKAFVDGYSSDHKAKYKAKNKYNINAI